MAFKDLNVDGLYQVLKKDLGADIATVIRDQEVLGQDYLGLTEADVSKLFPKMGQAKKVLRHIKSISDLTAEVRNDVCLGSCYNCLELIAYGVPYS